MQGPPTESENLYELLNLCETLFGNGVWVGRDTLRCQVASVQFMWFFQINMF